MKSPKPSLDLVPEHYIRKQTLVNAERYVTPELKEYEIKVFNAEDQIKEIERSLFLEVCERLAMQMEHLLENCPGTGAPGCAGLTWLKLQRLRDMSALRLWKKICWRSVVDDIRLSNITREVPDLCQMTRSLKLESESGS